MVEHSFNLKIGTCIFSIFAPGNIPLEIHPNISPFITYDNSESHVRIHVEVGLPAFDDQLKQLTNAKNLPEFYNKELRYHFYTLNRTDDQFVIFSGEEGKGIERKRIAVCNFDFRDWTIFISKEEAKNQINPLSFPLGPLVFYYGITKCNGVLLHASGINYNSRGYVFLGFSGIGKTTISNVWLTKGAELINDDRLALMRSKGGFYMYNSPMAYRQQVKESKITALFLLKQARENHAARLSSGAALARVLALCIQHGHDKTLVDHMVKNVHKLIDSVPVFELGFRPDPSVVKYIEDIGL